MLKRKLKTLVQRLAAPIVEELENNLRNEAAAQKVLMHQYRLMAVQDPAWRPSLLDVGFRKYSQFDEDGILLCLFSLIPPLNRTCVEICAGTGRVCNTANLIINHGWWGHLFDGDDKNVKTATAFFSGRRDTFLHPPRVTRAWITAENVNELIATSGVRGKIDFLSLDIDGMDYWIWNAIDVIDPQVVVCETHNVVPPDRAVTVPYDPAFVAPSADMRGASLAAMTKLGREKGYRLVGTHRFGFNAFFVKNGVGERFFPEVDVASCVADPFSERARKERWPQVSSFGWQEV